MDSPAHSAAVLSQADALVSVIAFAFRLVMFGAGIELLRRWLELRRRYRPAPATVVAIRSEPIAPLHPDRLAREVVFEYRTNSGVMRRMTSDGMNRVEAGLVPGQRVTVLYDPERPERAVLKTASAWVNPLFLTTVGLLIALIWLMPFLA